MAKKVKSISSLLDELDRFLYEGKWREIEQTLKRTSKKLSIPEAFTCFLEGEEHISNHLLGLPGPSDLAEAEGRMRKALELCEPGYDAPLMQLAKIKYGQLLWLRGEHQSAMTSLQEGVQCTADTSLLHTCKALVEGHLYLGLCFEQFSLGFHRSAELAEAITAYEDSTYHALKLLHRVKELSAMRHPATFLALKAALERATLLALQLNVPVRAFNLYRRVLQLKEEDVLQELRQVCSVSLASLLLFNASSSAYTAPASSSHSVPAPSQLREEAILTSFLAKSYVDTWTVSKKDPVPSPAVVFDLLTLVFSEVKLPREIVLVLEDSMRFACAIPHVWLQFALALVAGGKNKQALAVFHECISLLPNDPVTLATAANFALQKGSNPHLCITWATKASTVSKGHFLESKVEYLLGRGYTVLSETELSSQKRGDLHMRGLEHLKEAVRIDPQNIDYAFHLAVQLAESRGLTEADAEVRRALNLNAGHTSCLHLLTLILSAQKQYVEALKVCDFALQKQPENFGLLECKIKLEVITVSSHQALKTCKHALQLWQALFSDESTGLIGIITQDQHSLSDIALAPYERQADITAISPDVASDTGSSYFSLSGSPSLPNHPNLLQARIWCTVAEVFLSAGKISDAVSCIREAQYLGPHLPSVLVTHGRILELDGKADQAMEQYRNALILQPVSPTALTHIGQCLCQSERYAEAEKYLREATSINHLHHQAWYWLGKVFSAQGNHKMSVDCFKTALDLEETTPVQPFSAVLLSLVPPS